MKRTIFSTCAVASMGVIVAALYFQYLIIPIKLFYYIAVPMLFCLLITSSKKLVYAEKQGHGINIIKLSRINYLLILLGIQLLFYYLTIWMFSCYIYQTNINNYLQSINISAFIQPVQQHIFLYLFLPCIASTCCGVGLLYFVVCHKKSPFLTECFYQQPNKLPWLFIHNILIGAEVYSGVIVVYFIFIPLILILHNAFSLLTVNCFTLQSPFFVLFMMLPVLIMFQQFSKNIIGWFIRNKYSMGFIFVLFAIIFFVTLMLVTIFTLPYTQIFSEQSIFNYAALNKPFEKLLTSRWEILLLGWFFINMPKFGNFIGRISYGFTIREILLLNLIATAIVGLVLRFALLTHWQELYIFFADPFWLFYGSLPIIFILWLYASYVRDQISLWVGPMFVFPTVHFKNRSIIKFIQRSLFILLVLLGGAGFIGWRLSQYFVTFMTIFLLPVYSCFAVKLFIHFIKNKEWLNAQIAAPSPAAGKVNTLLRMSLTKKND